MPSTQLLKQAAASPDFVMWRNLAPRRFLLDIILYDELRAIEVLPASLEGNTFAVITTSLYGLPASLPEGFSIVASKTDYFATVSAPPGTTDQELREVIALEQMPHFYDSPFTHCGTHFHNRLRRWLLKELPPVELTTEEREDRDFILGNGRTPPQYHGYNLKGLSDLAKEPDNIDADIEYVEELQKIYA